MAEHSNGFARPVSEIMTSSINGEREAYGGRLDSIYKMIQDQPSVFRRWCDSAEDIEDGGAVERKLGAILQL